MPRGVVVARQPLELKSLVRTQAGQPNGLLDRAPRVRLFIRPYFASIPAILTHTLGKLV